MLMMEAMMRGGGGESASLPADGRQGGDFSFYSASALMPLASRSMFIPLLLESS